jgi:hypothetical protein
MVQPFLFSFKGASRRRYNATASVVARILPRGKLGANNVVLLDFGGEESLGAKRERSSIPSHRQNKKGCPRVQFSGVALKILRF